MSDVNVSDILAIFESLRSEFPHLRMKLEHPHALVELNMDIPQQPGLVFEMNLNLQGDELHLHAGDFWLEWFPCSRPDIVVSYCEAVRGLLSGNYRILEHRRGRQVVRAELQAPEGTEWKTVGTWSTWPGRFWLPRAVSILRNGNDY